MHLFNDSGINLKINISLLIHFHRELSDSTPKQLILRVVTRENLLSNVRHCVYGEDNDELPLENIVSSQPRAEGSYYVYEWDRDDGTVRARFVDLGYGNVNSPKTLRLRIIAVIHDAK